MLEGLIIIFLIVGIAYFAGGQNAASKTLDALSCIGCLGALVVGGLIIAFFVWINGL